MVEHVLPCLLLGILMVMGGRRLSRCCCDELDPCPVCDLDTTPNTVNVEFTGMANSKCADCGDWNTTTFVLPRVLPCTWQLITGLPCDSWAVCDAFLQESPTWFMSVTQSGGNWTCTIFEEECGVLAPSANWVGATGGGGSNCSLDVTSISNNFAALTGCDASGATCDVLPQ